VLALAIFLVRAALRHRASSGELETAPQRAAEASRVRTPSLTSRA
jgi:hypothetical protein